MAMNTDKLLTLAQKVILKAAGAGLDAAGAAVCGPAWPFFKKILEPVAGALEREYPRLFGSEDEAKKAADTLAKDRRLAEMLASALRTELSALGEGQRDIIAALARQGDDITTLHDAVTTGFDQLALKLDLIHEDLRRPLAQAELSIDEILYEVHALQSDATGWLTRGALRTAERRLFEASRLVAEASGRDPANPEVLALRGYIEKTRIDIAERKGDPSAAADCANEAAKYFAAALKLDRNNVSAMNGAANVLAFAQDYRAAAAAGRKVVAIRPDYGAAYWDLCIALERLLEAQSGDSALRAELIDSYRTLEALMPEQASTFSAADLDWVRQRLGELTPR